MGSPPHTWRILHCCLRKLAYLQDHLHTRGEYSCLPDCSPVTTGSPPHTWRIHSFDIKVLPSRRITSTHVENTLEWQDRLWNCEDHLHTRGEYYWTHHRGNAKQGSPPHTWRILLKYAESTFSGGITSTHVENTVNKSQYNNNHKTIDPKISSLCQLLLYLFLSH